MRHITHFKKLKKKPFINFSEFPLWESLQIKYNDSNASDTFYVFQEILILQMDIDSNMKTFYAFDLQFRPKNQRTWNGCQRNCLFLLQSIAFIHKIHWCLHTKNFSSYDHICCEVEMTSKMKIHDNFSFMKRKINIRLAWQQEIAQ